MREWEKNAREKKEDSSLCKTEDTGGGSQEPR